MEERVITVSGRKLGRFRLEGERDGRCGGDEAREVSKDWITKGLIINNLRQ